MPNDEKPTRQPYIITYESEMAVIAANAVQYPDLETGGELFGSFTHGGRPRLEYASLPGPRATHSTAHFQPDTEESDRIRRILRERYASQYLGDWHSHHYMSLNEPGGGDRNHVTSIATKNTLDTMAEIIITFSQIQAPMSPQTTQKQSWADRLLRQEEHEPQTENGQSGPSKIGRYFKRPRDLIVRINAFLYLNASQGRPKRIPIEVLPGMSPIRQSLLFPMQESMTWAATGPAMEFPLERVIFDRYERSESNPIPQSIIMTLENLIQPLPEHVKEGLKIRLGKEIVTVTLPLPKGLQIMIKFNDTQMITPSNILLLNPAKGNYLDVTRDFEQREILTLCRIYDHAVTQYCHFGWTTETNHGKEALAPEGGSQHTMIKESVPQDSRKESYIPFERKA